MDRKNFLLYLFGFVRWFINIWKQIENLVKQLKTTVLAGQWWNYSASQAEILNNKGIAQVYLPPANNSAFGKDEPGYTLFDLFDIGEFD